MASYQQPYTSGFVPPPPPGWGTPAFQQPAYGQAAQHQLPPAAPPSSGPPFKKQKGNPVITKYPPPPPGWKPPFQTSGYPPPAVSYESQQPPSAAAGSYPYPQSSHPALPYASSTPYSQPPYIPDSSQPYQQPAHHVDHGQVYQQPPQPSDPNQAYQQSSYLPSQTYQSSQSYTAAVAVPSPLPQSGYYDVNGVWQAMQQPYVAPSHTASRTTSLGTINATSEDAPVHARQASVDDTIIDFDFDGEGTSLTDDVDPRFSLGLIIWHPALARKRPLPSTFVEAELEALAPSKPSEDEDESISEYFVGPKKHQVELSIKQTEEWEEVKNDLIFVEFVKTCEVVPLATVIENRNRPELRKTIEETQNDTVLHISGNEVQPSEAVAPEEVAAPTQTSHDLDSDGDQAMDMSEDEELPEPAKAVPQRRPEKRKESRFSVKGYPTSNRTNILDSLESALVSSENPHFTKTTILPPSARYSRSRSPEKTGRSRQSSQQPKSKPASHPRDPTQESVLAALGVEGSPKTVYPTPPPALGAPASPERNGARSPGKYIRPMNGIYHPGLAYGPNFPPPPPPRESRSPSLDPWKAHEAIHGNPRRTRSPSATSQRTAAGSDFYTDDNVDLDATPKAKPPPSPPPPLHRHYGAPDSGRKRNYDRMVEPESDGRRRQEADTPRARRRPNYDRTDAYSRRW